MINVEEVKKKILGILEEKGPSLPVPLAKQTAMQPMFLSAILSELLNEKRIKTSKLKVGSSPLYLIPGSEQKLENFTDNLTGTEKEAYLILRDNKLLDDAKQEPKIRVALRSLKDFAIPIQNNGKLYWKYFTISNDKIKQALLEEGDVAIGERVVGQQIWEDIRKEKPLIEEVPIHEKEIVNVLVKEAENTFSKKEPMDIQKQEKEEILEEKKELLKPEQKQKIKKLTEKEIFLEQVKRILHSKNIEVLETIQYDKKQVIAKARVQVDKTCILFFFDKKKPDEKDLIKAYKKSIEYKLPYYILTHSEAPKKIKETAEVYKHLLGLGSVE
jgi:hypothetical protein